MKTILIVEDNDLNLKMARDLLQMSGFKTLEAEDAETGLQLAKENIPSLILMDMYLPIIDGYEATKTIKADPELKHIPVIAFSALAMEEERRKALTSGCSGFISKPIDVECFADTVSAFLKVIGDDSENILPPQIPAGSPEKSVNEEVEEFFMIASHDLQAPLRKIDQFINMLKRSSTSQISAEDFELIERMERSTQNMHELVSDMLTLSRINTKGGAFREVDLLPIVEESIRDNQSMIDKLDARIEVGNMVSLKADPIQLQQLIQILIENGLKFRKDTEPPILLIDSKISEDLYEISIIDNGIGFPQEHSDKIFRPFVRLHGASSKYPGRGMGLAIAHKIVSRHNGRISATSNFGSGSAFKVVVPILAD